MNIAFDVMGRRKWMLMMCVMMLVQVAHIMNDEMQRKYLTSVKRLMTYAQGKRDDVDPSMKVL